MIQVCSEVRGNNVQSHWSPCPSEDIKSSSKELKKDDPWKSAKTHSKSFKLCSLLTVFLGKEIGVADRIWMGFLVIDGRTLDPVLLTCFPWHQDAEAHLPSWYVTYSKQRTWLLSDRPKIQNGLDRMSGGLKINLIQLKRDKWHLLFLFLSFLENNNRIKDPRLRNFGWPRALLYEAW